MLRAPDGSQHVYETVIADMRTGRVWGLPHLQLGAYPVNGTDSKPRISHPFVRGTFVFDDTDK